MPPSPFPLSHTFLRRPRPMRKWIQGVWGRSGNPVAHRHVCPFRPPPRRLRPPGAGALPLRPPDRRPPGPLLAGRRVHRRSPPPRGVVPPVTPPPPAAVPVRAVGVHLRASSDASMEPNTDTLFPRGRRFGWGEEIRSLWGFLTEDGFHNPTPSPQNRSAPPQF